jgi:hypothetical protein
MRSFLRRLFGFRQHQGHNPSTPSMKRNMSSSTAAILYAITITTPAASPLPDDAQKKSHHLQGGFTNPWDSWKPIKATIAYDIIS